MKVGQDEAQRKLKVKPNPQKPKYKGNPKKSDKRSSETERMEYLEENDYAGIRSINDKKNVTEKARSKKKGSEIDVME